MLDTEEDTRDDVDRLVLWDDVLETVVLCVTVGVPFVDSVMGGVGVCRGVADTVFDDDSELVSVVLCVLVLEDAADWVEDGELVLDSVGLGARVTVGDPVIFVEPVGVCVSEGEDDMDTRWVREVLGERVPFTVGVPVTEDVVVLLEVVVREIVGVDVSLAESFIDDDIVLDDVVVFVAVSDWVVFAEAEEVRVPASVCVPVQLFRIVAVPWLEDDVVLLTPIDLVGVELAVVVLL